MTPPPHPSPAGPPRSRAPALRAAALVATLALLSSACSRQLRRAEPSAGPPASNECAVDVVNVQDVPMAVTLYARDANDLGVLAPGRTVRYAEECTPRSWTVSALPRTSPQPEPEGLPTRAEPTSGVAPRPVSVTVEVRPGHVARVELR